MDDGKLILKRDLTGTMVRLEVWSTKEGIYIQTFDIIADEMLSSNLINDKSYLDWSEIDIDGNTIWSDKALEAMSANIIKDLERVTHDVDMLKEYIMVRNNNASLLNEDAKIKGDCNDNNIPLEDFMDKEAEYFELTHNVHRDKNGDHK